MKWLNFPCFPDGVLCHFVNFAVTAIVDNEKPVVVSAMLAFRFRENLFHIEFRLTAGGDLEMNGGESICVLEDGLELCDFLFSPKVIVHQTEHQDVHA